MVPVFTDASSAILLKKAGLFSETADRLSLVFSPSVFNEMTKKGYPGACFFLQTKSKELFKIKEVKNGLNAIAEPLNLTGMGKGEADTLALFLEHLDLSKESGFILTDDGKAARYCYRKEWPFINALLVPKIFWYAGYMKEQECLKYMNTLCDIGRYTKKIKAFAFECNQNDLSFFINHTR